MSSPGEAHPTGWPTAPPIPADPAAPDDERLASPGAAPASEQERIALAAEAELIGRAQQGDRAALRDLYEQNVPMVFSFVVKRVGPDRADDLTAEVFTKAFERLSGFEWRGIPIRSWLLRIAFNEIVGRARRRSSTEIVTDEPDSGGVEGHEDGVVDALSAGGDVLAALERLSPQQRAAIELRYLKDLSVPETALVLDLQEDAVRALTYRALKALRAALT